MTRKEAIRLPRVAEPAQDARAAEDPPLDPAAVARAYRLQRAKRQAKRRHARERHLARLRFWLALVILTFALVFLSLTIWNQIEKLFGL